MELDALKTVWQARESKMEKSATIDTQVLDKIESQQLKSMLRPLLIQNWIVLFLHALAIIALVGFAFYSFDNLPYAASAVVLLIYYGYLTANCIQQINATRSVEKLVDIIGKQTALAKLNTRALNLVRLSILTIPVFLSFPVVVMKAFIDLKLDYFDGLDIITHTNGKWWTVELIVCLVCIPAGIWFYNQVKPANMNKQWVRNIIRRASSKRAYKAAHFLNEMQEIKGKI